MVKYSKNLTMVLFWKYLTGRFAFYPTVEASFTTVPSLHPQWKHTGKRLSYMKNISAVLVLYSADFISFQSRVSRTTFILGV